MKKGYVVIIVAVILVASISFFPVKTESILTVLFSGGTELAMAQQVPPEINLTIKKINGEWKVVDESEKTKVKAKKGAQVTWTAEGTDVYFQFMDGKLMAKEKDKEKARKSDEAESLPEVYTTNRVADGQAQSLIVRATATKGTYSYAVFCMADSIFATGDSPPQIIIE